MLIALFEYAVTDALAMPDYDGGMVSFLHPGVLFYRIYCVPI